MGYSMMKNTPKWFGLLLIFLSHIVNVKIINSRSKLITIFYQSIYMTKPVYIILHSLMYAYRTHVLPTLLMFYLNVHVLIMKNDVTTLLVFPNCYHVLNISSILIIPTYIHMHIYVTQRHRRFISIHFNINLLIYIAIISVFLRTSKQIIFAFLCFRVRVVSNLNFILIKYIFLYCYFMFCRMQPTLLLCTHLIHNTTVCSCLETTIILTFIALKHVICVLPELKLYMYSRCKRHKLLYYLLVTISIILHSLNINVVQSYHTCIPKKQQKCSGSI